MGEMRGLARFVLASLAAAPSLVSGAEAGYIEPGACASCHAGIYNTYRQTGMGRSFYRMPPGGTGEDFSRNNTYYHEASDQHFTVYRRDGRLFQRRHQIGLDVRVTNVIESEMQFVLGSGNHARTYLSLRGDGRLVELPVGWYSEGGGTWGMNPGYDRTDHMDFRRQIDRECFFCHNAYPDTDRGSGPDLVLRGAIPEGIDCQRCHGPGKAHVESARAGATAAAIRGAIVNPARLARDRQIELCFQCHLESTSRRLPYAVRHYGRDFFSYRPGEPLADYVLHFDRAGGGFDDRFEIDHAGYRLLQSACFRKSNGAFVCTTCHNPHEQPGGEEAVRVYVRACLGCHVKAHNAGQNCVECHMPKRRTDDVVHAVMTDHAIPRRRPARDLLAPLRELAETERSAWQGEVALLYPPNLAATGANELYLAVAQVTDGSNLAAGIPRLRKAIETGRPAQAEFYLALADGYRKAGRAEEALPYYVEALRRRPGMAEARRNYAQSLTGLGRVAEAVQTLEAGAPEDAATLNALGAAYLNAGQTTQSAEALRRALRSEPDLPEAHVNLGNALSALEDPAGAMAALRGAIRLRPGLAGAHNNLASLLQAQGDFAQARYHFERAIRSDPGDAVAQYNYGRALAAEKLYRQAEAHLSRALELDPRLAEAAVSLGMALERSGQAERAIESYRQAIRSKPGLMAAHFNLGLALARRGEKAEAKQHFEIVIRTNSNDHEARLHLGEILLDEGRYDSAIMNLQQASQSPRPDVRTAALKALQAAQSAQQNLQVHHK